MKNKTCPRCNNNLLLEKFSKSKKRKDGLQVNCKSCMKELNAKHYKDGYKKRQTEINRNQKKLFKEFVDGVKIKNPCPCGEDDLNCLDFHHLQKKKHTVSNMSSYSIETVKTEMNKCCVLCSNCHRKLHGGSKIEFDLSLLQI